MFARLMEVLLPRMIGVYHRMEKLTPKEHAAEVNYLAKLDIKKRKTEKRVIVAMIGLVGSGKSSVARELAKHIGGTVVSGDAIRVELRKQSAKYKRARTIGEHASTEILEEGGNVVYDSDFVDAKKRASLREKARKAHVRLVFICTYCDLDVMVGRILAADYKDTPDDFFGGASSTWKRSPQSKGAVVKIREMWRRTPHHYRWENKIGGQWVIKKPPCAVLADIDTTSPNGWKREVEKCAKKL